MKTETRELLKDNLVRINENRQFLRERFRIYGTMKMLIKAYMASPVFIKYKVIKLAIKSYFKNRKES